MTLLGSFGAGNAPSQTNAVPTVSEKDFEAEILRSELAVLLVFTSERSALARELEPTLAEIARELDGKAKVLKVDADRSPYLVRQLRVQQLPTFMVWSQGRPVDMQVGALQKKQLLALLDPFLPRQAGALKAVEVFALLKKGGMIAVVDTRDEAAFARAHIPGAVNMPLEGLHDRIAELYMLPGQPVLYCRSGDKTRELCAQMAEGGVELGFLEGGLLAWESEGFAIERS